MEGTIMAATDPLQAWDRLLERLGDAPGVQIPDKFTVLDHLLFGVAQEGAAPSQALEAYKNLVNAFFNFNEMRVAHPAEFVALLEGVPNAEDKAKRMLDILQFVFDTTYGFDLESMKKKPTRQAFKQLSKVAGATRFAVAATVQRALGGNSAAIDGAGREFLVSCGVAEPNETLDALVTRLETMLTNENAAPVCMAIQEAAFDSSRRESLAVAAMNGKAAPKKPAAKKPAKRTAS
jgi:hypothetical protein